MVYALWLRATGSIFMNSAVSAYADASLVLAGDGRCQY